MADEKQKEASVEDEFDRLWSEDKSFDSDQPSEPEPAPEPEPTTAPAPEPAQSEETEEALQHRLKSAEGRLRVFEEQVADMRQQLETRRTPDPEPEPEAEPEPLLPEGWSQEDWDDYRADNPVGAELHERQSREVQQLKEQVSQSVGELETEKAQRDFNRQVMSDHPDYMQLLENNMDDIKQFIEAESNPLLRDTYQQIYQAGTAQQVSQLVTAYKSSKGSKQDNRQSRIDNALAVQSRSSSPSPQGRSGGLPPEDDEDAAWDYFSDEAVTD